MNNGAELWVHESYIQILYILYTNEKKNSFSWSPLPLMLILQTIKLTVWKPNLSQLPRVSASEIVAPSTFA